jgi:hypothetical protein
MPPAQAPAGEESIGGASADSLASLAALWGYATRPNLPHKSVRCRPRRDPQDGHDLTHDIGEL